MDFDPDIGNWLIEFYLRQPLDQGTLNSLLEALPFSTDNPRFKKLVLLKKLEFEVSRQPVSENALGLMERLAEVGAVSDALRRAYCVAAVDCTLRRVKGGRDAAGRNFECFDMVKRLWRGRIGRMEKNEAEGGLVSEQLREWKDMIEAAVWDESACDFVLKKFEGVSAVEAVKVYVREERAKMGPSFLELVAEKVKTDQGLQKIMGVDGTPSSCADQAASGNRADQVVSDNCADQVGSDNRADQTASGSRADQAARGSHADEAATGSLADVAATGSADVAASGRLADVAASGSRADVAATASLADVAATGSADVAVSGRLADVAASGSRADVAATGSLADVAAIGSADVAASERRADVAASGSNPRKEMSKPRIKLRDKLVGLRHPRGLSRKSRGVKIADSEETAGGPSTCMNSSSPRSEEINKAREALKLSLLELRAAVKDPLPEALRVAEAISKEARQDKQHDPAEGNDGRPEVLVVDAVVAVQSSGGNANNVPKPSLMERNSSARTYKWDDSVDGSKDDIACRIELRVRSPKRINTSPLRIYEANNVKKRRPFRRWSLQEEETLREAVEEFGQGNWKVILNAHRDMFIGRTEVDLKDKWRNMTRYS